MPVSVMRRALSPRSELPGTELKEQSLHFENNAQER